MLNYISQSTPLLLIIVLLLVVVLKQLISARQIEETTFLLQQAFLSTCDELDALKEKTSMLDELRSIPRALDPVAIHAAIRKANSNPEEYKLDSILESDLGPFTKHVSPARTRMVPSHVSQCSADLTGIPASNEVLVSFDMAEVIFTCSEVCTGRALYVKETLLALIARGLTGVSIEVTDDGLIKVTLTQEIAELHNFLISFVRSTESVFVGLHQSLSSFTALIHLVMNYKGVVYGTNGKTVNEALKNLMLITRVIK